jgi:hypothetical protein
MKKIIFVMLALGITTLSFGQKDPVSAVFDSYAGKEGFTLVNVSGDMLKMVARAEETRRDTTFRSRVDEVRILAMDKSKEMPAVNFRSEVYDRLDKNVYKEMITVKQHEEDVIILVKETNDRISEFLIIVSGIGDNVLIQAKGDMLLSEMGEMAGGYKMKGFEHLKRIEK